MPSGSEVVEDALAEVVGLQERLPAAVAAQVDIEKREGVPGASGAPSVLAIQNNNNSNNMNINNNNNNDDNNNNHENHNHINS